MTSVTATSATTASLGLRGWWLGLPRPDQRRITRFAAWLVAVTVGFAYPLVSLTMHAAGSNLHSYIPLVPFISGYLLYLRRGSLPPANRTSIAGAVTLVCVAIGALTTRIALRESVTVNDGLTLTTLAYVSLVAAGGFLFLGSPWMIAAAFPFAFLVFMVPLPDAAVEWIETASVLASADVAGWLFNLTGTPVLRDGLVFALPTTVLRVGQECSGIRSSLVLFITSLIVSNLFLTSKWRRILLVAFVIPLGIVRNGFRILVIGLLCVHIGPHMIDSVIHRRGGPLFFALSLIPLFLFLRWLWRQEQRA